MAEIGLGEKMIAYCGLVCTGCPAYLATQANDEVKAKETADMWSKEYGMDVKVDDVWCDGCLVEGKKCSHCAMCAIRACAMERKLENCGHCGDYSCEKLENILKMAPDARAVLEEVRKSL